VSLFLWGYVLTFCTRTNRSPQLYNDDYEQEDGESWELKPKKARIGKEPDVGVPEPLTFKPQVSIALWKDENMHEFISVAIVTLAGLTKKDDTKVCVLDDLCHLLHADAKMPDLLSDVTALHRYYFFRDASVTIL
jgi:hypothetical protein